MNTFLFDKSLSHYPRSTTLSVAVKYDFYNFVVIVVTTMMMIPPTYYIWQAHTNQIWTVRIMILIKPCSSLLPMYLHCVEKCCSSRYCPWIRYQICILGCIVFKYCGNILFIDLTDFFNYFSPAQVPVSVIDQIPFLTTWQSSTTLLISFIKWVPWPTPVRGYAPVRGVRAIRGRAVRGPRPGSRHPGPRRPGSASGAGPVPRRGRSGSGSGAGLGRVTRNKS